MNPFSVTVEPKTFSVTVAAVGIQGPAAVGGGDVTGPASVTSGRVAVFSDGTGKLIDQGGYSPAGLLNRANHTGTQDIVTINGLEEELDTRAPYVHTHVIADITGISAFVATLLDDANASAFITTLFGGATGTGNAVRASSPTLVSPTLGAASATSLDVATGTITASDPVLDSSQTWNSGAVTFTGIKLNVTDTASATTSTLLDLQVAGTSKFGIKKDGSIQMAGGSAVEVWNTAATGSNGSRCVHFGGYLLTNDGNGNLLSKLSYSESIFAETIGLSSSGIADLFIRRIAAGHLGLSNGSSAQSFSVYNVAGTDYERGVFDWQTTAGVLTIGTQKGGAGSAGNIDIVVGGVRKLDYGITNSGNWTSAAQFRAPGLVSTGFVVAAASSWYYWTGRGGVSAPSDGVIKLGNEADTSFDRLQFGGTTSSFPAIKRRTTTLEARLADDSAITTLVGAMVLKAGAVSDADFTNPVNGCHGFDETNFKHYVRVGGVWKSSAAYT